MTHETHGFFQKKNMVSKKPLPSSQTDLSQKTHANGCMREPIELMKVKYNLERTTPTVVLNLQIFRGHK